MYFSPQVNIYYLLLILVWCSEFSGKSIHCYLWRGMSSLHTQRNYFQTLVCWRTWTLRDLLFTNCNPSNFINVSEENPAVLFSEATFLVSFKKILQAHVSTMSLISCRALINARKPSLILAVSNCLDIFRPAHLCIIYEYFWKIVP